MKRLTCVLLGVLVTLPGEAAGQGPADVIAYDFCQTDYWEGTGALTCWVFFMNTYVDDAVDPAWSPDGSRIAFAGYNQPGIFVLNPGDWSLAKLSSVGNAPAWSPDGMKLAFAAGELYVMGADGSNVMPLTDNVGFTGQPAWSPNGGTIAFDCVVESGNQDICSINTDGTGFVRLTSNPASDSGAAFSPDGLAIAFTYGGSGIAVMNPDGTGVRPVAGGSQPAWSPDGIRIAYVQPFQGVCEADGRICPDFIVITNVAGTERWFIARGNHPAFAPSVQPVAVFVSPSCNGLTCAFDGSGSWGGIGGIASYSWNFGDGTTDTGPTPSHSYATAGTYTVTLTITDRSGVTATQTDVVRLSNVPPTAAFTFTCIGWQCTFDARGSFAAGGSIASYFWTFGDGETSGPSAAPTITRGYKANGPFTVTLIVTDDAGATDTQQQAVTIASAPPVARFRSECSALMCTLDGSASSDGEGPIASHAWSFGDGTTAAGVTVSHTYAAGGSYTVTLTVTDVDTATATQEERVTVVAPPALHVGDLDGRRTVQLTWWTATVTTTVHDVNHHGVASAVVSGIWNDGAPASCTTSASGRCTVSRAGLRKTTRSVSYTVTNVALAAFVYTPADNHDPDGDSNGSSVSVSKP